MTLEQSIRLNDGMSAVLKGIQNNMKTTIQEFKEMQEVSGNSIDISYLDKAVVQINRMGIQLRQAQEEQERFQKKTQQSTSEVGKLLSMAQRVAVAVGGWTAITKAFDLSDSIANTTARLNLMNDGLQTTAQLQGMIYQAAENSRGSYLDMQNEVAKLGLLAGNAFDSSAQIVQFAEQLNKQFVIAGASTTDIQNATLQLTQALSSGVLQGDELRSIFEQAPTLIQGIADYMGVPIGKIRELASEGEITADIVIQALLAMTEETNAMLAEMPLTWSQLWTDMKREAVVAFSPVMQQLSDIANSSEMQTVMQNVEYAISVIAGATSLTLSMLSSVGGFVVDNWSIIEPVIWGVVAALVVYNATMGLGWATTIKDIALKSAHAVASAGQSVALFVLTVAQEGLNVAMAACPITWIIIGIVAIITIIFVLVAAINKVAGTTYSVIGVICGLLATAAAFVVNIFISIWNVAMNVFTTIYNLIATVANFLASVFVDPVGSVVRLFAGMADAVLNILSGLASAIDAIFGSNLQSAVEGWRSSLSAKVEAKYGTGVEIMNKLDATSVQFDHVDYGSAFSTGYDFGSNLSLTDWLAGLSGVPDMNDILNNLPTNAVGTTASDLANNVANTAANTANTAGKTAEISDKLSDNTDELQYLREIMEEMVLNKIYTTNITVSMENNITSADDRDLDGIVDGLADRLSQMSVVSAEGVYA